ncbi:chemotaxis protein CheW [Thalassotalea sp. PLHSN55]|uniref:chemotaxis protein CheW n=1 Tax=Thalassotalea sp. PLHSN55 TaxID=3435888 RepID=UPI003F87A8D9
MSKSLAASKTLMKNYLSELLTEDEPLPEVKSSRPVKEKVADESKLEKLLETVSVPVVEAKPVISRKSTNIEPVAKETIATPVIAKEPIVAENTVLETKKSKAQSIVEKGNDYRKGSFQAMFFDVAGLTVAVPLIELGGIHNAEKTNSLVGKPDWFKGVMVHREEQINVVDTALWVMPEKCDQALKESLDYKYVIMLGSSQWGLLAENLIDTVTLEQEDVKWLAQGGRRPWLAGLVKDRMCALLEVDAFIQLLNDGCNVNQI